MFIQTKQQLKNTKIICFTLSLLLNTSRHIQAMEPDEKPDKNWVAVEKRMVSSAIGSSEKKIREEAFLENSQDFKNKRKVYRAQDMQKAGNILKKAGPALSTLGKGLSYIPYPPIMLAGKAIVATGVGVQAVALPLEWRGQELEAIHLQKLSLHPSSKMIDMERKLVRKLKRAEGIKEKLEKRENANFIITRHRLKKIDALNDKINNLRKSLSKEIEKKLKEKLGETPASLENSQKTIIQNIYKYVSKSELVEPQIQGRCKYFYQVQLEENQVVLNWLLNKNDQLNSKSTHP